MKKIKTKKFFLSKKINSTNNKDNKDKNYDINYQKLVKNLLTKDKHLIFH